MNILLIHVLSKTYLPLVIDMSLMLVIYCQKVYLPVVIVSKASWQPLSLLLRFGAGPKWA